MNRYVFSPAGATALQTNILRRCIEFIGSKQSGKGSNFSKGKRFLRDKLGCTGTSVKRTIQTLPKTRGNDYEIYGLEVYYYHIDFCDKIIGTIIEYIINEADDETIISLLGQIPPNGSFKNQIYGHQLIQLEWVCNVNYKNQGEKAQVVFDKFKTIPNKR